MSGADWDAIQKQAAAAGASAVELDDTTAAAFPAPDLVRAVFDAPANAVTGPVQEEGGWSVFKVTKLQPSNVQPFAAVEAEVKGRVALEQATDQVYDRANEVQDALAGGAKLDELPGGLGLLAVTGTLDAAGNTPGGTPAPIPASPALRQALIAKAFAIAPTDQPTLEDGPDHSFYAVSVDSIIPPAQQPLDAVKDRVRDDWLRDTRKHEQDLVATKLLTAVNGGASLKDAAAAAGVPMTRSPPIGRTTPPPGIPAELVQPLFATDTGHATMVESPTGFTVAVTVAINKPDPSTNAAGMDRVRTQLGGSMSDDLEMTFAAALRDRDKVVVNRQLLDSVAQ
jgi:peptidyl-prolyl cis-trans isomerase D